ncbi:ABC transporter ATP-binding protein [Phreatobacter sp.]|uniref:ABC transporter ATP-binding protein n=1 Tax=Phreatobacter sp. TaxID=1966341 RepID=UPI003F6E8485
MSVIEARDLALVRGGRRIVDGVTLALGPTGSVAIIGPNGAGKSSLARILAGQIGDHGGQVTIDGEAPAGMTAARRTALVGYVPQSFVPHWNITPRMLMEMGAARRPGTSAAAVAQALARREVEALADRPWSTLSGGERARALLAAVEVTDPPALIADEPGASLDIRHRIDLVRGFSDRGRDRLVVVVMHDVELATAWFDRIVVMEAGRIRADGASGAIVRSGVLDQVFGVPFEPVEAGGALMARPVMGRG